MNGQFIKLYGWTEAVPDLTLEEEKLINILLDIWYLNNKKEFICRNAELSRKLRFKPSYAKRGLTKAKQTLKELKLITYRKSGCDGCCYSINEETVNKLSGIADTSTLPANKETTITSKDEFNKYLLTVFDKNREALLNGGVEAKDKLCDDLSTKEAINLLGSKNNFNANYYQQFRLWYQRQNDLKSQAI